LGWPWPRSSFKSTRCLRIPRRPPSRRRMFQF
jgi:hypothetical protein